jgi:hypothetical protein
MPSALCELFIHIDSTSAGEVCVRVTRSANEGLPVTHHGGCSIVTLIVVKTGDRHVDVAGGSGVSMERQELTDGIARSVGVGNSEED